MTTISTPVEQTPTSAGLVGRPDVNRKRMARLGWAFSAPALIIIAAVTIFPIIYSVVMSLSNVDRDRQRLQPERVHLEQLLAGACKSSKWHYALGFTIIYTLVTVLVELVLGTMIALVLERLTAGRGCDDGAAADPLVDDHGHQRRAVGGTSTRGPTAWRCT